MLLKLINVCEPSGAPVCCVSCSTDLRPRPTDLARPEPNEQGRGVFCVPSNRPAGADQGKAHPSCCPCAFVLPDYQMESQCYVVIYWWYIDFYCGLTLMLRPRDPAGGVGALCNFACKANGKRPAVQKTMFPPTDLCPGLEHCMRMLPHHNNAGTCAGG